MAKDLQYYLSLQYDIKLQQISAEDGGGWLARIDELEGCIADGESPDEAVKNIEDAKKDWIQFCIDKGMYIPEPEINEIEDFSGKFTLRVSKKIHSQLTKEAEAEGISVNNLVNNFIVMGLQNTSIKNELSNLIAENIKPNINVLIEPSRRSVSNEKVKQVNIWGSWDRRLRTADLFHA